MVTSAGLLHEFLPASEIFRVAEAVLRVFQRLGDYQHKQRNRMKFMIKTLGWTRWREEYDRELTACRLRGAGADARDRSAGRARRKPDWVKDSSPSVGHIASRVAGGRVDGPGHHADDRAGLSGRRRGVRAMARDQRAAAEAVRLRDGDRDACRSAT